MSMCRVLLHHRCRVKIFPLFCTGLGREDECYAGFGCDANYVGKTGILVTTSDPPTIQCMYRIHVRNICLGKFFQVYSMLERCGLSFSNKVLCQEIENLCAH